MPDPSGKIFARWILQTWHLVETAMIKFFFNRRKSLFNLGEIEHPSKLRINGPVYMDFDPEAVPMHTSALVPCRHIGEPMSRFDMELFEYLHRYLLTNSKQLVRL